MARSRCPFEPPKHSTTFATVPDALLEADSVFDIQVIFATSRRQLPHKYPSPSPLRAQVDLRHLGPAEREAYKSSSTYPANPCALHIEAHSSYLSSVSLVNSSTKMFFKVLAFGLVALTLVRAAPSIGALASGTYEITNVGSDTQIRRSFGNNQPIFVVKDSEIPEGFGQVSTLGRYEGQC